MEPPAKYMGRSHRRKGGREGIMEPHDRKCMEDIEGTVTAVNEQLLFFTLDGQYNVYVIMKNALAALPEVKDKVTVESAHCIRNDFCIVTYYLCGYSSITVTKHVAPTPTSALALTGLDPSLSFLDEWSLLEFEQPLILDNQRTPELGAQNTFFPSESSNTAVKDSDPVPASIFWNELLTLNPFGLRDVRQIDHSYHTIKKCFGVKYAFVKSEQVVEWLISRLLEREATDRSTASCTNRILPHFQVKTISDACCYVDAHTKKGENRDLHYWGFGTHHYDLSASSTKKDCIFGYLCVNTSSGMVVVGDARKFMPVVMKRDHTGEMSEFMDCLVLIKKYCVVTEFFQSPEVRNLQCMLLDPGDLEVVARNSQKIHQRYSANSSGAGLVNSTEIKILSVSSLMYNYRGTCEYWMEMEFDTDKEKVLVCMSGKGNLEMKPFLQPGLKCTVLYGRGPPAPKNDPILAKLVPHKQCKLDESSRIVPQSKVEANEVMDVKTCLEFMKINRGNSLISFRGKIKFKRFTDPLSSRSARKINTYGFGTPGHKTHHLEFLDPSGCRLKLYLNNWESLSIPMGLIPNMIVTVRNVANQKGQYCKSTALTSFEIIDYDPSIAFQSVNLCTEYGELWGKSFHLSLGHKIPVGVLIWCPVISIFIKSFKISVECAENCQNRLNRAGLRCDSKQFTFSTVLAMNVMDGMGEATLISKSIDLLRVILDYVPEQFASFLDALHQIRNFEYEREVYLTPNEESNQKALFQKTMSKMITYLNSSLVDFHFYCRKLSGDEEDKNANPVWYCLKARKGADSYEPIH